MGPEKWEKNRHVENDEFWDDQDCGPNGHFIVSSAVKRETPEGKTEIIFKEEQISNLGDRPQAPPKFTSVKSR